MFLLARFSRLSAVRAGDFMNISDFYRDEAVRCQHRAQKSRNSERAKKWQRLADEYLRLALQFEGNEPFTPGSGAVVSQDGAAAAS